MIRAATAADIEAITRAGFAEFQRNALSTPTYDQAATLVRDTVKDGFVIVSATASHILGSLGLRRGKWDSTGEAFLSEKWLHASGAHCFKELIEGGRAIAARLNLPLYVGVTGKERVEAMTRLYRMAGGVQVGASFRF